MKINGEHDASGPLMDQLEIRGYPTFVVVDGAGETIRRWAGYRGAAAFLAELGAAVADPVTIDARRARFARNRTLDDARVLTDYFETRNELRPAAEHGEAALALGDDPDGDMVETVTRIHARGLKEGVFDPGAVRAAFDRFLGAPSISPERKAELVAFLASRVPLGEQSALVAPYVDAALALQDLPDGLRRELEVMAALHRDRDADRALALEKAQLDHGWEKSYGGLNEIAWWCYQTGVHLDQAAEWARQGAALAPEGQDKADVLDTLARILYTQGHRDEAIATMKQAVAEMPKRRSFQRTLASFEVGTAPRS